jgi:hypothetical protein
MAKKGKVYVNVYLVECVDGGPEEGGWTYQTGEPVESHGRFSRRKAQLQLEEKKAWCAEQNRGRPPIWSVRSFGVYEAYLEDHPAEQFPKHRPHYE